MTRYLITSALPYINGIKHLGNLVGSMLPADVYARYLRQRGNDVLYICATDEHGTPAELAAAEAGLSVSEYCRQQYEAQAAVYTGFRLSFDHFGRSSSPQNRELTQHIGRKLAENGFIEERVVKQVYSRADERFLPDRYVIGTCPHCGYEAARGDQCENCTRLLDPDQPLTRGYRRRPRPPRLADNRRSAVSRSDARIAMTGRLVCVGEDNARSPPTAGAATGLWGCTSAIRPSPRRLGIRPGRDSWPSRVHSATADPTGPPLHTR